MADCARYEPTIEEILADPTIHALMRADRVNPDRLRNKLLRHVSATGMAEPFAPRRPAGPPGLETTGAAQRRAVRG